MYETNHIGPTCQAPCGPSFDRWHDAYALWSSVDILEYGDRGQHNIRDSWYEGGGEVEHDDNEEEEEGKEEGRGEGEGERREERGGC